jgi:thiol:disulfide interchange protein
MYPHKQHTEHHQNDHHYDVDHQQTDVHQHIDQHIEQHIDNHQQINNEFNDDFNDDFHDDDSDVDIVRTTNIPLLRARLRSIYDENSTLKNTNLFLSAAAQERDRIYKQQNETIQQLQQQQIQQQQTIQQLNLKLNQQKKKSTSNESSDQQQVERTLNIEKHIENRKRVGKNSTATFKNTKRKTCSQFVYNWFAGGVFIYLFPCLLICCRILLFQMIKLKLRWKKNTKKKQK